MRALRREVGVTGLVMGQRLSSRFELLTPLGRGGFGSVYEARDKHTGQHVALKELGQASGDNLARFKQEFRALSGLHHPNLVSLRELFEQEGRWFIVMELIAGSDFVQYVRAANANGQEYDERRLRVALAGITQGLSALHEFGILHRDLKPSNVCVTPDGRAVLLDFGLVTSVDPMRQSTHGIGMGTVAYMAPEQGIGRKLGPPADWYALGVCLFEALTDRLPFEGSSGLQMLLVKQQRPAPRAGLFARNVPQDLEELCDRLLQQNPEARPTGAEVLSTLGVRGAPAESGRGSAPLKLELAPRTSFAGRETEIENLERALGRTHEGEFRLLLVEGESGVGKSELVAEFLRGVRQRHASLVTLSGRCYENEQLPYKAFDGCIDELAKLLRKLSDDECRALLPARAALLGQLFPVLNHVPSIAKGRRDQLSADPTARRLEAFEALAQLLAKLAEDRPVVLVIDDLQWADAESFRLLKALVDRPERPPILIVATIRPRDELDSDVLAQVERVRAWQCTDVQLLYGLPALQAESLAASLLGPLAEPTWVRSITEESRGHPLFLSELVHYARSREIGTGGVITLDAAIRSRIERLAKPSRELLELVAVAARPYGHQVFARALRIDAERSAQPLLQTKLLRVRRGSELGCYHDRIRHVAVDLIARTRLPQLHRQLAAALSEESGVDRAELARHWDLAGESERASEAYEDAASAAMQALAFTRAAELSERALQLLEDSRDERYIRLLAQRADALACSGRSAQAATLFARAADLASGDERIRLQGSAANQLMLSAQFSPGLRAARQVLAEVGVALPLETGRALLRFVWERLRHALFGRPGKLHPEEARTRRLAVELVASLNRSIGFVHPPAYLALTAQYVRLAASLGDEAQLACAYAAQGYLNSLRGSIQRGAALFDRAKQICLRLNQPRLNAWQTLLEGTARMVGWDIVGAEACLVRAHDLLQAHCPDQPRELTQARFQLGVNWHLLGKHKQQAVEMERWLAEARERDDALGVVLLLGVGYGFLRHLLRDAVDEAISELEAASARVPAEPFGFAQLGQMLAMEVLNFYRGGPGALRWLEAHKEEYARPFLLKTPFGRETYLLCSVMATLHACQGASERELARLLRSARSQALELGRRRAGLGKVFSQLALAQLEALSGRTSAAQARLRELRTQIPGGVETLLGQQALYLEGVLEQSEAGERKCEQALTFFREQGWKRPERAVAMHLPLLARLGDRLKPRAQKALLLERYQVIGQLGRGGFGNVVVARDTQSGAQVALKEFVGTGAKPLERFKLEFRALQSVHHPNLVRLHALFEHEGAWYIAMELVEGHDLVTHVRASGQCDRERLRSTAVGLARALAALHEAGFVHRDLTPSNVCVSAEGRPVLLDFGLIGKLDEAHDSGPLGTPAYSAPEQLEGATASSAADVYALGACMYEALVGEPPFVGDTVLALLQQKRTGRPNTRGLAASHELALCLRMLDSEPQRRPSLAEVIAELSQSTQAPLEAQRTQLPSLPPPRDAHGPAFWGRAHELGELTRALTRSRTGSMGMVLVRGESGVGKSALVAEFVRRVELEQADTLVVTGRCYENEQLTLKAFDAAVDQIARVLSRLPSSECEPLLPRRAGLLVQLFPVLASVPAFAAAGKKGIPADPAARKLAAYDCFVSFLARLGQRFVFVLVLDDLQWADQESFRMLRQLIAHARQLRLLVIATTRPEEELESQAASEMEALSKLELSQTLRVSGLRDEETAELAAQLVSEEVPRELIDKLVQESRGHPLFLRELIERARTGTLTQTAPSLDDAIRARVERLDPEARAILDLVALSGRPYRARWFARALGSEVLSREALSSLLSQGLLRGRGEDELSCYHDRIRHVVAQLLTSTKRQKLAGKLAAALEADSSVDPAERARLWDIVGDGPRAIAAYEQAGERALEALSFARAEQHYARALELLGSCRDASFVRIAVQRGHALVRMGKSADAARVFQSAAEFAPAEIQARLRMWAAQHLIQGAHVAEGLSAATVLLSELGLPLARTERQALLRIGVERARIALRGAKLKHQSRELDPNARLVLEALHGLSSPVRAVSYLPGSMLVVQYLRRALHAGDPTHAARALAYEGLWRVLGGASKHADALLARSRELADGTGEDAIVAEVELMRGLACLSRCEFTRAAERLGFAHELLQSRCPGQPWLLTSTRMYLGSTFVYLGDYRAVVQHSEAWLAEAKAKQDRYAVAALAGLGGASLAHLVRDDPEAALTELREAMAPWPEEPFSTNHFGACGARASAFLYKVDPNFLEWTQHNEQRLRSTFLMRTPACRLWLLSMSVFACLQRAAEPGADRVALIARARGQLRALAKVPSALAPGVVQLTSAILQGVEGQHELALVGAQAAQRALSATAFEQAARYVEGVVEGGEGGSAKRQSVHDWLLGQGFRNPGAWLRVLVPGLTLLQARHGLG
jgi:serine/threonine protein kinase/predicted ATPase